MKAKAYFILLDWASNCYYCGSKNQYEFFYRGDLSQATVFNQDEKEKFSKADEDEWQQLPEIPSVDT